MEKSNIKKSKALSYGLIAGLLTSLLMLFQYLGGIEWFNSPVGHLSTLFLVAFAVIAALGYRKANEGYMEFGEALKITFTVFAVGLLVQTVFAYILVNFIDPSFREVVRVHDELAGEKILRGMGFSDDQIDERMQMQRKFDRFTVLGASLGYGLACIFSFIFCLLISVIVRRSKPVFTNM